MHVVFSDLCESVKKKKNTLENMEIVDSDSSVEIKTN